jgi:hypothetical protein
MATNSSITSNKHITDLSKIDWLDRIYKLFHFLILGFQELYFAIKNKTFPWLELSIATSVIGLLSILHMDRYLYQYLNLNFINLGSQEYRVLILLLPLIGWIITKAIIAIKLRRRLVDIFTTGGLKTASGRLPELISDLPVDNLTRRFRFERAIFPIKDFDRTKSLLESGLRIYIDEFREVREKGTVDAIYSKFPMPLKTRIDNIKSISSLQCVIGRTRTKEIRVSLKEVPHFLVAGQTGGGKSTFLRQFITSLYLNNKDFKFTLIDLKGGLEFQMFEKIPRVEVIPTLKIAVARVSSLSQTVETRMAFLKEKKFKDIDSYHNENNGDKFDRHIIVIDEAAEIFLSGGGNSSKDIQGARKVLSEIARKGRAVGIHLVIATQRPDAKSLDPQVKANLIGRLCFQMPNDASSITVLGNGRATEISAVPGRAIWQNAVDQTEVQTPYLSDEEVETLLEPYRLKEDPKDKPAKEIVNQNKEVNGEAGV